MNHLSLLLIALLLTLPACRSKKDAPVVEQNTQTVSDVIKQEPLELSAPTPEQLALSPCGNPDWAGLPPDMDPAKAQAAEKKKKEGEAPTPTSAKPSPK